MPIYTCTTNNATLTADSKTELATEIASIHASINHVPSTYINIIFHELPAESVTPMARRRVQSSSAVGCAKAIQTPKPPGLPPMSPLP